MLFRSVQMRSGGRLEVVGGFSSALPLDGRIGTWAKLLLAEAIPDKAAYDLEEAMAPLLERSSPDDAWLWPPRKPARLYQPTNTSTPAIAPTATISRAFFWSATWANTITAGYKRT